MRKLLPLLLLIPLLLLSGCGDSNLLESVADDSSVEAKRDQGLEAINNKNYTAAILIFEELNSANPADTDIAKYLASAYAGKAGFNTLTIIDILAKEETGEETELFEAISTLFGVEGDIEGDFTIADLDGKIDDVDSALATLTANSIDQLAMEDNRFQAGLYAAVQTVLLSANILDGTSIEAIKDGQVSEQEIADKVTANFNAPLQEGADTTNAEALTSSLLLVVDAKEKIIAQVSEDGEENDLNDDFNEFLTEIGFDDNDITAPELEAYLKSFLP